MKTRKTYFCDVSQLGKIHLSGQSVYEFVRVMTTLDMHHLDASGRAGVALVLNAEGDIIDVVMVARTGSYEYIFITHPQTVGELTEWLQAHAKITSSEGTAVFEDIKVENKSRSVASFALYGPKALAILNELGQVDLKAKLGKDKLGLMTIGELEVLVIRWPFLCSHEEGAVYEVYLPAQGSEVFKEILLGFAEIDLEEFEAYKARRSTAQTWFTAAEEAAYIKPKSKSLQALMRLENDFVGARALEKLGLLPHHINAPI